MIQEIVTAIEQISIAVAIILAVVLVVSVAMVKGKEERQVFLLFLKKGITLFAVLIMMENLFSALLEDMWLQAILTCLGFLLFCKDSILRRCQKKKTKRSRKKGRLEIVIEN